MSITPNPLYFDTAATTPVDKTVAEQMAAVMLGSGFANPGTVQGRGRIAGSLGFATIEIPFAGASP
jgi:cysteine sulfinate desulfinase/cysteine desulfurase-like protein